MKKSTLFLIILVAVFFTSTLVLLCLNYLKPVSTSTPTTGTIPPTTITPDPVVSWETYNSPEFGFSIDYPQNLQVQDYLNDQYNRTVSFKGTDLYFSVTLRKADSNFNLDKYYFMDSLIARTTVLSGQKANIYEMPNGYCDGPGCSQPYIAIVTEHNGDVYSVSFFGDSKLSSLESQILSSFRFMTDVYQLSFTLDNAKSACISLQGQKAWDSNFSECNEAGTAKDQLKKLCDQYGGVFYPDSSTCRHTDFYGIPCGPEATYYCSFANLK